MDPSEYSDVDPTIPARWVEEAWQVLRESGPLTPKDARNIFQHIDLILSNTVEAGGFEWDDAWDTLRLLKPRHASAIPAIVRMLRPTEVEDDPDEAPTCYAIRALGRIDPTGEKMRGLIVPFESDRHDNVRRTAVEVIRAMDRRSRLSGWINRLRRR